MTSKQWRKMLTDTAAGIGLGDGAYGRLRSVLVALHEVMLEAPIPVKNAYKRLTEEELQNRSATWRLELDRNGFAKAQKTLADDKNTLVLDLGAILRALDDLLATSANQFGFEADIEDLLEGDWYVIPRKIVPHWKTPRTQQGYLRRGILHHRCLPSDLDGVPLKLVRQETMRRSGNAARDDFGAAFFDNFKLITEPAGKNGFVASRTKCDAPEATVDNQLEQSCNDNHLAVVWPELTIMPALHKHIVDKLRRNIDKLPYPEIVIPGSWHVEEQGQVYNRAIVYNRYGRQMLSYDKIIPFDSGETGPEIIEPGNTITVLMTDDYLVAVAICKDYCDLNDHLPYHKLNVDLILVPSMSGETAMASHRVTAKTLRTRFGTRTFIVQQLDKKDGDNLGMVLPPQPDPANADLEVHAKQTWHTFSGL